MHVADRLNWESLAVTLWDRHLRRSPTLSPDAAGRLAIDQDDPAEALFVGNFDAAVENRVAVDVVDVDQPAAGSQRDLESAGMVGRHRFTQVRLSWR